MWSRNINVFAQLEGNISPPPMVEFDTRLDKSYRQPRLPHSTTKHAKQPQPHWERGAWCNAAQLLLAAQHDRNLWTETPPTATSCHPFPQCIAWQPLCNKQLATPPHSVKERSQRTLQAARWTRLHFSLVCSESAAFNHSLTAAAGSTWRCLQKLPMKVPVFLLQRWTKETSLVSIAFYPKSPLQFFQQPSSRGHSKSTKPQPQIIQY